MTAWHAVILAASRGASDPMAQAYGSLHKCMITIGGVPMLARVVDALRAVPRIESITVSTEQASVYQHAVEGVIHCPSLKSAPSSAMAAIEKIGRYPVLITTGDHALLTPEMVFHVCATSEKLGADFTAGLATAETVLAAYPDTKRTFFRLGPDSVSGCNLFTVHSREGLRVLQAWQKLESSRKQPWRLIGAFGFKPLLYFVFGKLSLQLAFEMASQRLGCTIKPLLLPFAEAAIDVDKPSDKELAETIVARRGADYHEATS
jgi:GTP:adenosylcobinamide-phosphate guanylyltransferase